ncbi:hypothetical protein [Oryzobacter telluris]|uniref:hypothetical protein n=1 Tax=Oryzobacter telluris TaxID=3149179 RepID=UPI00370DA4E2
MYFLSTIRHLDVPLDDVTRPRLLELLDSTVRPRALTLAPLEAITFYVSDDGRTMQTLSRFSELEHAREAERSAQHASNASAIETLLGITAPREQQVMQLLRRYER